jgi:hypothetical protein
VKVQKFPISIKVFAPARQFATHVCQLSYIGKRGYHSDTLHSGIIDSTSILMLGADSQNNQLSIQKSTHWLLYHYIE